MKECSLLKSSRVCEKAGSGYGGCSFDDCGRSNVGDLKSDGDADGERASAGSASKASVALRD